MTTTAVTTPPARQVPNTTRWDRTNRRWAVDIFGEQAYIYPGDFGDDTAALVLVETETEWWGLRLAAASVEEAEDAARAVPAARGTRVTIAVLPEQA